MVCSKKYVDSISFCEPWEWNSPQMIPAVLDVDPVHSFQAAWLSVLSRPILNVPDIKQMVWSFATLTVIGSFLPVSPSSLMTSPFTYVVLLPSSNRHFTKTHLLPFFKMTGTVCNATSCCQSWLPNVSIVTDGLLPFPSMVALGLSFELIGE